MSKIEEIKARWAAATPGPWIYAPSDSNYRNAPQMVWKTEGPGFGTIAETCPTGLMPNQDGQQARDAQAIAAAPEDIRWLVERVERLEATLREVDELEDCAGSSPRREAKRLIREALESEAAQC